MSEIPRSMSYAMRKANAVQAETNLRQFAANNGTVFSPTVNEMRINVSADGFLDGAKSYLYFTIANLNTTAANNLKLDSDALCWIDQIRVESQGVVLERLERAGVYAAVKGRWQDGMGQLQARTAKMGGPALASTIGTAGQEINEGASATFACKLPLGILNAHHGRAIPAGGSFDIVIRVNSTAAQCFKWEGTTPGQTLFEIRNPRFYAPVYRIDNAEVMSEYGQALMERGIMWSGDVVKTYINSVPAGAATRTAQINDRSVSLKALVTVPRLESIIVDVDGHSIGSSSLLGLTGMRYVISGQNYPQDTVQYSATDAGRLYEEAQKALAKDGDNYCEPTVDLVSFTNTASQGQGVIAVDLRKFDDEKLMLTGMNTASTAAPNLLELIRDGNATATDLTTFAICDAVFQLDGRGSMSSSS